MEGLYYRLCNKESVIDYKLKKLINFRCLIAWLIPFLSLSTFYHLRSANGSRHEATVVQPVERFERLAGAFRRRRVHPRDLYLIVRKVLECAHTETIHIELFQSPASKWEVCNLLPCRVLPYRETWTTALSSWYRTAGQHSRSAL